MFENQLEVSNPFKGPPRPELEEAWHKLLNPAAAVRVEKEVLDRINRTSVALQDGSGYMVGLDVYHQLHCLVRSHRDNHIYRLLNPILRDERTEICPQIPSPGALQYDRGKPGPAYR